MFFIDIQKEDDFSVGFVWMGVVGFVIGVVGLLIGNGVLFLGINGMQVDFKVFV